MPYIISVLSVNTQICLMKNTLKINLQHIKTKTVWLYANGFRLTEQQHLDHQTPTDVGGDVVLLSTETRLFTKDITDLTHSERVSTSTSSFLAQHCAYSSTVRMPESSVYVMHKIRNITRYYAPREYSGWILTV